MACVTITRQSKGCRRANCIKPVRRLSQPTSPNNLSAAEFTASSYSSSCPNTKSSSVSTSLMIHQHLHNQKHENCLAESLLTSSNTCLANTTPYSSSAAASTKRGQSLGGSWWWACLMLSLLLILSSSSFCGLAEAKHAWERPGCHKVGHTRKVQIPECVEFTITTNACRGYCESFAVPSAWYRLQNNPSQAITSVGQCCNIMETEDVTVNVMCMEGQKELVFKSAKSCACYHCKKD